MKVTGAQTNSGGERFWGGLQRITATNATAGKGGEANRHRDEHASIASYLQLLPSSSALLSPRSLKPARGGESLQEQHQHSPGPALTPRPPPAPEKPPQRLPLRTGTTRDTVVLLRRDRRVWASLVLLSPAAWLGGLRAGCFGWVGGGVPRLRLGRQALCSAAPTSDGRHCEAGSRALRCVDHRGSCNPCVPW